MVGLVGPAHHQPGVAFEIQKQPALPFAHLLIR
jgi:hypothetical protein